MVAKSVRVSERNSVVLASNRTQAILDSYFTPTLPLSLTHPAQQDAFKYLSKIWKSHSCIFSKSYLWSVNNKKMEIFYLAHFFYDCSMWRGQKMIFCQFLADFFMILETKYTLSDFKI